MAIQTEKEFKTALAALPLAHQRQIAAVFVQRVLDLSHDVRVKNALTAAARADITPEELALAAHLAHSAQVASYAQCGHDSNWECAAGHFVARAAECSVRAASEGDPVAWEAAMQARLARTCQMVAQGEGTDNDESAAQHQILETFLQS
jgi:3'-phosphoadenosine 5'-phosphosulfate (PAPS) 3'-phosphatase